MASALMVVFTAIIAIATVVYAVVTFRLWKATKQAADAAKQSADAAKLSAEAAKKSADISAALHRPYLGVSDLRRHNDCDADVWAIQWRVKNFGTLPASAVRLDVSIQRDGGAYGEGPGCVGCKILPQAEIEGFLTIAVDRDTRARLSSGDWPMTARVEIVYLAPGGARYTHDATFAYDRTTQNFKPERSETRPGNH
jgi:hypothetical protein